MVSVRDINIEKGMRKFNGDVKSFLNMLMTFDKLTLDECLTKIYVSMHKDQSNVKQIGKEIYNLQQSAQTVEANGLSESCSNLNMQISKLEGVHNGLFHSLVVLDRFLDSVLEFKDEIKKLNKREYVENTQIAKGIKHDIKLTIININEEQNQLHQSRIQQQQQQQNYSLNNTYAYYDAQQQHQHSVNQSSIEQQNQNYSYFINLHSQKEQIVNQVASETKSLNTSRLQLNDNSPYNLIRKIPTYPHTQYDEVYETEQQYANPQKKQVTFNTNPEYQHEGEDQSEDCKCNIF